MNKHPLLLSTLLLVLLAPLAAPAAGEPKPAAVLADRQAPQRDPPGQAAPVAVSLPSLLQEMTDRTVLTHWPILPYRLLQASSYNRASKTPDDPVGWFANADCGFALRTETNGGRQEAVLMVHHGPGVLTRIWTPFFCKSFRDRVGTDLRLYLNRGASKSKFLL